MAFWSFWGKKKIRRNNILFLYFYAFILDIKMPKKKQFCLFLFHIQKKFLKRTLFSYFLEILTRFISFSFFSWKISKRRKGFFIIWFGNYKKCCNLIECSRLGYVALLNKLNLKRLHGATWRSYSCFVKIIW